MSNPQHSSASNEHFTPRDLVEAARRVMAGIDVDPFSCEAANAAVGAARYMCLRDPGPSGVVADGFAAAWGSAAQPSRVLCNPPGGVFGRTDHNEGASRQAAAWFKHAEEWASGRVLCGVHVCFSLELLQRSQQHPFRLTAGGASAIPLDFPVCYPATRVRYRRMRGGVLEPGNQPPHASCLVLLPVVALVGRGLVGRGRVDWREFRQVADFVREFSQFGRVVVPG